MLDITVPVTTELHGRLAAYVTQVNARTGANFTLEQWARRHWLELVTNQDLNIQVEGIRAELQAEQERRVQTARVALMTALDPSVAVPEVLPAAPDPL